MQRVLEKLDPKYDPDIHANITYLIAEILLRATREIEEEVNPMATFLILSEFVDNIIKTFIKHVKQKKQTKTENRQTPLFSLKEFHCYLSLLKFHSVS
jgi:hypothetical protein